MSLQQDAACGSDIDGYVERNTFIPHEGGFIFDDDETDENEIYQCLLSALLAGLYEIPREKLLRHQTGFGRRIKYKTYNRIEPMWKEIESGIKDYSYNKSIISNFKWASIEKIIHSSRGEGGVGEGQLGSQVASFRIFMFDVNSSIMEAWGSKFIDYCIQTASLTPEGGIEVSNAGGYHSKVTSLSETISTVGGGEELAQAICEAVDVAEAFDSQFSQQSSMRRNLVGSEGWINVSAHSCFNRLHTHEKSAWSGVLYLTGGKEDGDCVDPIASKFFSGNFILKPTSHPSETTYKLNDLELSRLNLSQPLDSSEKRLDHCDYVRLSAKQGRVILFPSWCHHAVLPVAIKPQFRHSKQGLRISVAFNFNEI